jgi:uncharacterized protein YyaL (SSP411 family)
MGILLDRDDWKQMAEAMTGSLAHLIKAEPAYMSHWAIVYAEIKKGLAEVALTGENIHSLRSELHQNYFPFMVVQGTQTKSDLPLLKDKIALGGKPTIYVCYNKTCKVPVHTIAETKLQLTQ